MIGVIRYNSHFKMLRHSIFENTSQITSLHRRSFYKPADQYKYDHDHCFICKLKVKKHTSEERNMLFRVCDCKAVHLYCFKEIFKKKKKVIVKNLWFQVQIKDFYCKNCNKYYNWHAKTNKVLKIMIDVSDVSPKNEYIFMIHYSPKLFKSKTFSFLIISLETLDVAINDLFKFNYQFSNEPKFLMSSVKKNLTVFSFQRKEFSLKENS